MPGTGQTRTDYDASLEARALVERTTAAQGLPNEVADQAALARVATIIRSTAVVAADQQPRTGRRVGPGAWVAK